jgi:hypothetical protein
MLFAFGIVLLATLIPASAAHAVCKGPKNICKHFDDCLRTFDPNNNDADAIRAGVKARNGQLPLAGAEACACDLGRKKQWEEWARGCSDVEYVSIARAEMELGRAYCDRYSFPGVVEGYRLQYLLDAARTCDRSLDRSRAVGWGGSGRERAKAHQLKDGPLCAPSDRRRSCRLDDPRHASLAVCPLHADRRRMGEMERRGHSQIRKSVRSQPIQHTRGHGIDVFPEWS